MVDISVIKKGDNSKRVPKRVQVWGDWYNVKVTEKYSHHFHLTNDAQEIVYDMTCPYFQDEWFFKVFNKDDGSKSIGQFNTREKKVGGAATNFEL